MRIFVYGTLKRKHCRASALSGEQFLGEAKSVGGYNMFSCGSYPALVETEDKSKFVEGELYEVSEKCVDRLDQIEGRPFLYDLKPIMLEGETEPVHSYFYQRPTTQLAECGPRWTGV